MSINVPQSLLNVSNGVKVQVNMAKFSDKQLKNITKYVTNLSVPNTNVATAHVAQGIIDYLKVPHFTTRADFIGWHYIPHSHPIFEKMYGAVTVALLGADADNHWWYVDRLKMTKRDIENKTTHGSIHMYGDLIDEKVKKEIWDMASYKHELSPEANEFIENILTRKIQFFDMDYAG